MRYAENHKQETHRRLLRIAARTLREKGPDRLGVAEIMRAAGLTHGGFYAHFHSKDALLAEAMREIFAQMADRSQKLTAGLPPRHALATFIDSYVSPSHRDNPADGCPVAGLNSDLPRQSKKVRDAFDEGVKRMVAAMEDRLANAGLDDARKLAPAIVSAMIGAVGLSRAVSDRNLSDELLAAARSSIKTRLGLTDAALSEHV